MPGSRLEHRISSEFNSRFAVLRTALKKELAAGRMNKEDVAASLADFRNGFESEVQPRRERLKQESMRLADLPAAESGIRGALQTAKGVGSTMSFGATDAIGTRLDSLLQGRPLDDVQIEQEAQTAASPRARMAGEVAGSFFGGPALLGKGLAAGTGRLLLKPTMAAAEHGGFAGNVGKIALEGLRGATVGGGSAAGTMAIEGLMAGKDKKQISSDIWFPLTTGVVLGGSGSAVLGAARTKTVDKAGVELLDRMKRVAPGFRHDVAFLRQHGGVQSMIRWLANAPIGKGMIRRFYENGYLKPTNAAIADLRRQIGGGDVNPVKAAASVRSAVGVTGQESGVLQKQIEGLQRPAFTQEGSLVIPQVQQDRLIEGLANMDRIRAERLLSRGERSTSLSGLAKEIKDLGFAARRVAAGAPKFRGTDLEVPRTIGSGKKFAQDEETSARITVQVYENLKMRAREIAQFDAQATAAAGFKGYSKADVQDARRLYALLNRAERETSPMVDRAMKASQPLRKLQAELRPLVPAARSADDSVLLQQVFTGKNPKRRLEVLQRVMPADQAQSLAGTYFADFLEDVTKRAGGFNGPKAQELWRSSAGKYRAEMFDQVVGSGSPAAGKQFRETITDIFDSLDRASKSVGAAEGSQTAGYLGAAAIAGSVILSLELVHDIITDPRIAINRLEMVGGAAFAVALISSAMGGKLSSQLDKLATGQIAGAATRVPVAASELRENLR